MTIREYAKSVGHEIVGKLTRQPDGFYGIQNSRCRLYMDEAGNEYSVENSGFCIVTADGKII